MKTKSYNNWWFLAINGIVAILFGLLFLFYTDALINFIITAFGIIILAVGIVYLAIAIYNLKKEKGLFLNFFLGIIFAAIGLFILIFPKISLGLFLVLIGFWAITVGIFQLVILLNVGKKFPSRNLILFNALLIIAMGLIMFFRPFEFTGFVVKLLGFFSIVFGVVMIYLSFIIRKVLMKTEKDIENNFPTG
jgi:uncharacterized membrane protein HdeD (DUF308 family)